MDPGSWSPCTYNHLGGVGMGGSYPGGGGSGGQGEHGSGLGMGQGVVSGSTTPVTSTADPGGYSLTQSLHMSTTGSTMTSNTYINTNGSNSGSSSSPHSIGCGPGSAPPPDLLLQSSYLKPHHSFPHAHMDMGLGGLGMGGMGMGDSTSGYLHHQNQHHPTYHHPNPQLSHAPPPFPTPYCMAPTLIPKQSHSPVPFASVTTTSNGTNNLSSSFSHLTSNPAMPGMTPHPFLAPAKVPSPASPAPTSSTSRTGVISSSSGAMPSGMPSAAFPPSPSPSSPSPSSPNSSPTPSSSSSATSTTCPPHNPYLPHHLQQHHHPHYHPSSQSHPHLLAPPPKPQSPLLHSYPPSPAPSSSPSPANTGGPHSPYHQPHQPTPSPAASSHHLQQRFVSHNPHYPSHESQQQQAYQQPNLAMKVDPSEELPPPPYHPQPTYNHMGNFPPYNVPQYSANPQPSQPPPPPPPPPPPYTASPYSQYVPPQEEPVNPTQVAQCPQPYPNQLKSSASSISVVQNFPLEEMRRMGSSPMAGDVQQSVELPGSPLSTPTMSGLGRGRGRGSRGGRPVVRGGPRGRPRGSRGTTRGSPRGLRPRGRPRGRPPLEGRVVVVPPVEIEQELGFLAAVPLNPMTSTVTGPQSLDNHSTAAVNNISRPPPSNSFMDSFLKFLEEGHGSAPSPPAMCTPPFSSPVSTSLPPRIDIPTPPAVQDEKNNNVCPPTLPPAATTPSPSPSPPQLSPPHKKDKDEDWAAGEEEEDDDDDDGGDYEDEGVSEDADEDDDEDGDGGRKRSRGIKRSTRKMRSKGKEQSTLEVSSGKRGRGGKRAKGEDDEDDEGKGEETRPRRELWGRKAKEKVNLKKYVEAEEEDEFLADEPDIVDSDSDPAWTPYASKETRGGGDSSDEEGSGRRRSRRAGNSFGRKRGKGSMEMEAGGGGEPAAKMSRSRGRPPGSGIRSTNMADQTGGDNATLQAEDGISDTMRFKSGEFVAQKSELEKEEHPTIWRVDGLTLLQKYAPFLKDGKTYYRNISTYSAWMPNNHGQYQQIQVKYVLQSRNETIVEFIREPPPAPEVVAHPKEEATSPVQNNQRSALSSVGNDDQGTFKDKFDVYVQTLISQALDTNFLNEIYQEKDDYFVPTVENIDSTIEDLRRKMVRYLRWNSAFELCASAWPCVNVVKVGRSEGSCEACNDYSPSLQLLHMFGQPYDSTTLQSKKPSTDKKEYLVCVRCAEKVTLYNQLAHQKYHFYVKCANQVTVKRERLGLDATTDILKELLADETWLATLLSDFQNLWLQVEKLLNS